MGSNDLFKLVNTVRCLMSLRHITVSKENYQHLKDLGRAGDSFNDVITKILDKIDSLPGGTRIKVV